MYNPESLKAEEFISHEEILSTLEYAEANKNNIALIDEILDKAKLRQGLPHREASVLLACELADKNAEICALAEQIKKTFTATGLFCLRRCIFPTIASTAVSIVRIMPKTNILPAKK